MLGVQTYTAESGVCSTCFVTALYWNKDCCIRNKETSFISYSLLQPIKLGGEAAKQKVSPFLSQSLVS